MRLFSTEYLAREMRAILSELEAEKNILEVCGNES
jgi:hypothetical protein